MQKVLVANRGEIAIRVFRAATELGWATVALCTENDSSHSSYADEFIELNNPSDYMNVQRIVESAISSKATHIHPGYGFLSEAAELASACLSANITFIGPSIDVLRVASNKMLSRELAESLNILVAPGKRVDSPETVVELARYVGFPVMIKALDGGGGRGIRICEKESEVADAFKRCLGESPSRQLFAEKALKGPGWKHVEIQVVGDGQDVAHLWERECSVQRRFQKIVEIAPSALPKPYISPLINSAVKMAASMKYKGLGTFEFLVNTQTQEWAFLEINPRVQVEHTVTEEITGVDLVRTQLLLSLPNSTLSSLSLCNLQPPAGYAIQLRLTAEDPAQSFRLSPGTIRPQDIAWPGGRGIRVDTWLSSLSTSNGWTVGTDFDSLLAKIIVHAQTFEETTQKAKRALRELRVNSANVRTNIRVLSGVLEHPDWKSGNIDTLWLERNIASVLELGGSGRVRSSHSKQAPVVPSMPSSSTPYVTLQPGTTFHLALSSEKHTMTLSSIVLNTFPERLSGTLQTSLVPQSGPITFDLSQSTSVAVSSEFELGNPNNLTHVSSPLTGKIVELINPNKPVRKGEMIAVLSVMKMESVVSAPRDGLVVRIGKGVRVGVVIGDGTLLAVVDGQSRL
ncbi:hypothetical protein E1B28_005050 [Marasmius oreades]|uniref:Pyruvate carboxylase n=1 Tax=Marasmius oreades TaxID=181124 RepID=A0A9P7V024_9AGAR|nr:uncharacterized protein E1B28_005050 [Marasmius oreades]KAG7097730.1 hypothetical protein E1B28_005050 [Marasmius oreades]